MLRLRRSIQELVAPSTTGEDRAPLEDFIRAYAAIQAKPASDPDSFFMIGGYHGAPFRDPDGKLPPETKWWGGYCFNGNVLFPTWHRAYLLHLEDALRRVPGCEDVSLCYWDETFDLESNTPIPSILTDRKFYLDGKEIDNPLYSYKLAQAIKDQYSRDPKTKELDDRYTKPKGYETVRFPLSGLVGSDKYREDSRIWNLQFEDEAKRAEYLNGNIRNWLLTGMSFGKPPPKTPTPIAFDSTSVYKRFRACLETKQYTVFSNTVSQNENTEQKAKPDVPGTPLATSLESPHNSMHLALGGFYQPGAYLANPKGFWKEDRGSNGDMGANEMAGFDPIFFLHHAFIDYVFWLWQKNHDRTSRGSVYIENPSSKGAKTGPHAQPGIPPNTALTMQTPLRPFKKPGHTGTADSDYYASEDLIDINTDLGYDYAPGSLDFSLFKGLDPELGGSVPKGSTGPDMQAVLKSDEIKLAQYPGSFVMRTYATTPSGETFEVGREAVLSRWTIDGCANCLNRDTVTAVTPISREVADFLREDPENDYKSIKYELKIQATDSLEVNRLSAIGGADEAPPTHGLVNLLA